MLLLAAMAAYYNVIQCTGGTLTMNGCTITKTGDGSGLTR